MSPQHLLSRVSGGEEPGREGHARNLGSTEINSEPNQASTVGSSWQNREPCGSGQVWALDRNRAGIPKCPRHCWWGLLGWSLVWRQGLLGRFPV